MEDTVEGMEGTEDTEGTVVAMGWVAGMWRWQWVEDCWADCCWQMWWVVASGNCYVKQARAINDEPSRWIQAQLQQPFVTTAVAAARQTPVASIRRTAPCELVDQYKTSRQFYLHKFSLPPRYTFTSTARQ